MGDTARIFASSEVGPSVAIVVVPEFAVIHCKICFDVSVLPIETKKVEKRALQRQSKDSKSLSQIEHT